MSFWTEGRKFDKGAQRSTSGDEHSVHAEYPYLDGYSQCCLSHRDVIARTPAPRNSLLNQRRCL